MADKEINLSHPLQGIIPGYPVGTGPERIENRIQKIEIEQTSCSCSPEESPVLCKLDERMNLLHAEDGQRLRQDMAKSEMVSPPGKMGLEIEPSDCKVPELARSSKNRARNACQS